MRELLAEIVDGDQLPLALEAPELPAVARGRALHGGADLVRSTVETYTDYYAFLFDQLGMGR